MIIPLKYAYLFGTLFLLAIWLLLYLHRKNLRAEMWVMSVMIGAASVITGYYWWTVDWWRPVTITGTVVGIEDFLIGFTGGALWLLFTKRFLRNVTISEN